MSSLWKHGIVENLGTPDKYNPWYGLQISTKDVVESEERPKYSTSDLEQLFSHELAMTKTVNNRPARYWCPILSLFHGFRVGEVSQITVDSIRQEHGIWFVAFTKEMRLKNKNAIRPVPLHQEVLKLQFLDFVKWRRKNIEKSKSTDRRLFVDLKEDGARKGGTISTWWNSRYASRFDLTPKSSFHSLRHSCATQLNASKSKGTHIRGITGHVRGKSQLEKRYAKTVLEPLLEAVGHVEYPTLQIPPWSQVKIKRLHIADK